VALSPAQPELATRSVTGRTKCDWPAPADWLLFSYSRSEALDNALSPFSQLRTTSDFQLHSGSSAMHLEVF